MAFTRTSTVVNSREFLGRRSLIFSAKEGKSKVFWESTSGLSGRCFESYSGSLIIHTWGTVSSNSRGAAFLVAPAWRSYPCWRHPLLSLGRCQILCRRVTSVISHRICIDFSYPCSSSIPTLGLSPNSSAPLHSSLLPLLSLRFCFFSFGLTALRN